MSNKPVVFPLNPKDKKISSPEEDFEIKREAVVNQIYTETASQAPEFADAVEAMRKRNEEQMRVRDEAITKNINDTKRYQEQYNEASTRQLNNVPQTPNTPVPPIKPPVVENYGANSPNIDPRIVELSQPQYNGVFDLLPLPSEGKIYPSKKKNVRVGYMTTTDEDVLTSPNLLESGQFLEILINRKLLDPIRYRDLHTGDRNAIMIWLRATTYGYIYPITLLDEKGEPFETEFDLSTLKTIPLGAEPDAEGYFDFHLKLANVPIKFKLLTVGDVDDIEAQLLIDKASDALINKQNTYSLLKQIVEVNGNRDRAYVESFVTNLRIKDAQDLREYINEIESGIDLNIEVVTPSNGVVKTFLPLNFKFFWPNSRI